MSRRLLFVVTAGAVALGLTVVGIAAGESATGVLLQAPGGLGSVVIGGLLVVRVPGNRVGPTLVLFGVLLLAAEVAHQIVGKQGAEGLGTVAAVGEASLFVLMMMSLLLLILIFPTGRPRWRWLAVASLGVGTIGFVAGVAWAVSMPATDLIGALSAEGDSANPAEMLGPVLFFGLVPAIASLTARYRSGDVVERAQIRWLLYAVAVAFLVAMTSNVTGDFDSWYAVGGFSLAATMIPVAIGLAITRYRLFDIDRLIARTASYAVLVMLLGLLYGILVFGPTLILRTTEDGDASPAWVVAGSTLAVAGVFAPLRRRVQVTVERRFDRSRYDSQRVVDGFGSRVRDLARVEEIVSGVGSVVAEALRPGSFGVWIRKGSS